MTSFTDACTAAMRELAQDPRTIFVGQNVLYPGHVVYQTVEGIPEAQRLEVPVFENTQMGLCTGLALAGYLPICIFPRMDFMLLAMDQLVNHLDKLGEMSQGQFRPKVIVRTMLGNTAPLHPGPQHCQDHTEALRLMLKNTPVLTPQTPEGVRQAYQRALAWDGPSVVVEPAYR